MRQFCWKHPWSNAADTLMAELLQARYLYCYPGLMYKHSGWIHKRSEVQPNEFENQNQRRN